MAIYPSYLFKSHDPILDLIMTMIEDSGATYAHIERRSGVSITTLRNWRSRKVKRPQFATINAVARCLGRELAFRKVTNA